MKSTFYLSLLIVALAWCEPLLPTRLMGHTATVAAASVVSYTLVNADNDTDIQVLTPGIVLDLATLPTRNLNIRANTNPATTGSVVFALTGAQTYIATENVAPYALFSDYLGDYFAWNPALGNYTLVATPFDGPAGGGLIGTPLILSFSIISSGTAITSYTLVNADTDLDLLTLTSGATLNLGLLPRNLNIRANGNATIESVELNLTGAQSHFETQNVAPYALFGDFGGDYFAWPPTAGAYTLTSTPFDAPNGGGNAGVPLTITFTLTGASPLPVQLTNFSAAPRGAGAVQLRWNTASEKNNREFEVQRSIDGKLFGVVGRVAGHGSSSTAHDYVYIDEQLSAGNPALLYYRLRQIDADGTATLSPVRSVAPRSQAAALRVVTPTVADGQLYYTYSGPATGTEQLELYTLMGQRWGSYQLPASGAGSIPVAGLPPGSYVLRLMTSTGRYTSRFVLP